MDVPLEVMAIEVGFVRNTGLDYFVIDRPA